MVTKVNDPSRVVVHIESTGPALTHKDVQLLLEHGRIKAEDAEVWGQVVMGLGVEISPGVVHPTMTSDQLLDHVRWIGIAKGIAKGMAEARRSTVTRIVTWLVHVRGQSELADDLLVAFGQEGGQR